jgi:hypothetical protein
VALAGFEEAGAGVVAVAELVRRVAAHAGVGEAAVQAGVEEAVVGTVDVAWRSSSVTWQRRWASGRR